MKTKAKGTNDDSNAVAMRENDTTLVVDDYELDEEIHKQICQLADSTLWLKFTKSGFVLDRETGTTTKTITGVVIHEDAGWVRFPEEPGSPPDKKRLDEMAKEQAAAEGFELRVQLRIRMGDSLFGLDLPPSSAFRYSRYSQLLAARKLLPNEVVTRFTTAEATNKRDKTKKYAVVNFETIAPLGDDPPVDSDDDEGDGNGSSGDDDIPFCCDGGCDAKHE